jgi:hypothetical protein
MYVVKQVHQHCVETPPPALQTFVERFTEAQRNILKEEVEAEERKVRQARAEAKKAADQAAKKVRIQGLLLHHSVRPGFQNARVQGVGFACRGQTSSRPSSQKGRKLVFHTMCNERHTCEQEYPTCGIRVVVWLESATNIPAAAAFAGKHPCRQQPQEAFRKG